MSSEYGFVYVLGNDSMPGIFNIGFTTNHPRARMEQLSSATACPTEFDMLACFGTEDPKQIESTIHEVLRPYRINPSREFFSAPAEKVLEAINCFIDWDGDLANTAALQELADIERHKSIRRWKLEYFLEQEADPNVWPRPRPNFSYLDD